jgi:arylsulfatase A-like enzyme
VTASVCSPSRAGLLTGRYQQRFGHEYNLPGQDDAELPASRRGLPLDQATIADVMQRAGYATGIVGKWHLGRHPRFRPLQRGFDEFFGMVRGGSPYLAGTATGIYEGEDPVEADSLLYLTDAFGDRAVQFIEQHHDEPFFLFVSFNAPHTPMEPRPGELATVRASFDTDERAANVAMTAALDDNVGKILAALEAHELDDNTLVVFTNDNGGAMPYNGSLNAPLRGTKGTVLEGGNRVPMSIRWPARLEAGGVYENPVSTLDFLPSFAAAGGITTTGLDLDGVATI